MLENTAPTVMLLVESGTRSRLIVPVLKAFQSRGIHAEVTTLFSPGELHDDVKGAGLAASSLGCRTAHDYPRAVWRLTSKAQHCRTDVIFAVEPLSGAVAGLAYRLLGGPKVIFNRQHVSTPLWKQSSTSRLAATLADRTVCVSKASAEAAVRLDHVSPAKVHVVYSGIPEVREVAPAEVKELRSRLGFSDAEKIIVMVGRLRPEKGHAVLIRALPFVRQQVGPVRLVLVGSGFYEPAIRELACDCEVPIHFAGHQQDVAVWYALADVIAMPSLREAFGLVAAEAMWSRRPLVASGVGGLLEIIDDEKTGILVPPSDERMLASALARVLTDDGLARGLANRAYEHVTKNYTIDAMVGGWAAHCTAVAGRNPML